MKTLAGEIRTVGVVVGSAGGEGRTGTYLDRRAQLHGAAEPGGDVEGDLRCCCRSNKGKEIVGELPR